MVGPQFSHKQLHSRQLPQRNTNKTPRPVIYLYIFSTVFNNFYIFFNSFQHFSIFLTLLFTPAFLVLFSTFSTFLITSAFFVSFFNIFNIICFSRLFLQQPKGAPRRAARSSLSCLCVQDVPRPGLDGVGDVHDDDVVHAFVFAEEGVGVRVVELQAGVFRHARPPLRQQILRRVHHALHIKQFGAQEQRQRQNKNTGHETVNNNLCINVLSTYSPHAPVA